jgi:predicted metal-dependent peptidase
MAAGSSESPWSGSACLGRTVRRLGRRLADIRTPCEEKFRREGQRDDTGSVMEAHTKQIMAARTALVLDQPFFGVLALRLRIVVDPSCKTAWVDGRSLGYNPTFVESLSHAKLVALVAHEVMHCACGHPWRRDQREKGRWNGACDYAINPILAAANFTLPDGALFDDANRGKSAEWIYDRLPKGDDGRRDGQGEPQAGDDGGDGQGAGSPDDQPGDDDQPSDQPGDDDQPGDGDSPQGEVRDAPADAAEDSATEGDWSAAVQQAANAAKAQGKLSGDLERFAADAAEPKVDWRSALRRFVQETAAADYTWKRPSARYVARGMYLPSLHSEQMGPLLIAIDTSGSVDEVTLAQFEAEVRTIVDEMNPSRLHVAYADAAVKRIDTFEQGDAIEFDPVGGGGTKFGPLFDAIPDLEEPPVAVVYLTDLEPYGENGWPSQEPEMPTLWATVTEHEVPFGEVLLVS